MVSVQIIVRISIKSPGLALPRKGIEREATNILFALSRLEIREQTQPNQNYTDFSIIVIFC